MPAGNADAQQSSTLLSSPAVSSRRLSLNRPRGEKVNARTEQLRDQIEKSTKSERRGLKAREDTMLVDGSLSSRETAAPSHEISRCGLL